MKPLNIKKETCVSTSSNCVIWNGPDIACIDLCKGASVTEVVYQLATELCKILDILNIDTYVVDCLNLGDCGPKDFAALIQVLIDHICALEDITPIPPNTRLSSCPDCIVPIASCFYFENQLGDQETTMQLIDYVTAIGNYICALAGQINTINNTLIQYDTRITILENTPPPVFVLPMMVPVCVLPQTPSVSMDVLLAALESQFCALQAATGLPNDIYTSLLAQCAGLNQAQQLQGTGIMSELPGWNSTVNNLAEGIINMWLTICDMRAAILSIQNTCCTGTTCDDLNVTLQAVLTSPTTLQLFFNGTTPAGFGQCNPAGSVIVITDESGNSLSVTVPILPLMNDPGGYLVNLTSTPINTAQNLLVTVPLCFTDGDSQCSTTLTDFVLNTVACPTVTLIPTDTTIGYSANYVSGPASITIKLFDATGAIELSSQTIVVLGPGIITGTFTLLSASTQYRVRIEITPTGSDNTTICPFGTVVTLPQECLPPTFITSELNIV